MGRPYLLERCFDRGVGCLRCQRLSRSRRTDRRNVLLWAGPQTQPAPPASPHVAGPFWTLCHKQHFEAVITGQESVGARPS